MPRIRDPYAVLGITQGASLEDVQAAFMDLSLRFHPDRSPHHDPRRFLEIQKAYELLSNPAHRQAYDLAHAEPCGGDGSVPVMQTRSNNHAREEARRATGESARDDEMDCLAPPRLSLQDGWAREQLLEDAPVGEVRALCSTTGDLQFRLVLSTDEATHGGRYIFAVPMQVDCPACGPVGGCRAAECGLCEGTGAVLSEHEVEIVVPPGIRDGQSTTVTLDHVGLGGWRLHLFVKIQD